MTVIADDTQTRLLEAAGRVFARKGFEAATVREICREAEVQNIAAINYHFGDKEKLYQEAVKVAFKGNQTESAIPGWTPDVPLPARLRDFIRHFAKMLIGDHRPEWHYHLMARELAQPSSGCTMFIRDFARPHFEVLVGLVRELLPKNTPSERIHLTSLSIVGQIIYHRCARNIIGLMVGVEEATSYTAEKIGEHVAEFSLKALGLTGNSP